jgi:hypothetical protein
MNAASAVRTWLLANTPLLASEVFVSTTPDMPHDLVVLSEYNGGGGVGVQMGNSTQFLLTPGLQMKVRGAPPPNDSYSLTYDKALYVWRLISTIPPEALSAVGGGYLNLMPNGVPEMMRRDGRERLEFVSNFTVTKESTS